jgi:hypothetical protein
VGGKAKESTFLTISIPGPEGDFGEFPGTRIHTWRMPDKKRQNMESTSGMVRKFGEDIVVIVMLDVGID